MHDSTSPDEGVTVADATEQALIGPAAPGPDICAALAKAQAEFDTPTFDSTARVRMRDNRGEYTFKFASLTACLKAVQPALGKHGLFMRHQAMTDRNEITVWLEVWHSSGQRMMGTPVTATAAAGGPQAIGSILTYLRRYTVHAFFGISAQEDDDGNAAEGNHCELSNSQSAGNGGKPAARGGRGAPRQRREAASGQQESLAKRFARARKVMVEVRGEEAADKVIDQIKSEHPRDYNRQLNLIETEAAEDERYLTEAAAEATGAGD